MSEETLRCPRCNTGMLTIPLIEIQSEDDITEYDLLDFSPDELDKYLDGLTAKERKRIKERIRYRKNYPSSKHHSLRKEIISN